MKTLILYQSKTGFTRQYAEWLHTALHCDVMEWKNASSMDLSQYDRLIYGGGFYAGQIAGLKHFLKKAEPLKKQIVVFVTGASPVETEETRQSMRRNFTDSQWENIRAFYLPGGLCYEKMGLLDKLMMAVFRAMMKKKEGPDSPIYKSIQQSYSAADEKHIAALIAYCKEN